MQLISDRLVLVGALAAALLNIAGCTATPPREAASRQSASAATPDSTLRAELLVLAREDQQAREGFADAAAAGDTAFLRRLLASDSARTERLKEIVRVLGWPSPTRVGPDGAEAAWLVLVHSPDVHWQSELLPLLQEAADAGEVPRQEVALLTDKILLSSGQAQRYGSQFLVVNGQLEAQPIEDLAAVDALRARVGLPAMAEYVKQLAEAYGLPVVWPPR